MNFTYPVEEYFNQIEAYKKLENPVFSPDDSDEKILGELEKRSVMKKEISDKVNLFISEYIERFERSPELLTASDALRLSDLPDRLYPQSEPLGLDAAISLRIAVILRDHCKRIGDTDGLDAATDLYGRPYRKCKTLDELIAEFRSGAGDRYGGEAASALTDPEVYKKLQYLITEGRKKIYCRIYRQKKKPIPIDIRGACRNKAVNKKMLTENSYVFGGRIK